MTLVAFQPYTSRIELNIQGNPGGGVIRWFTCTVFIDRTATTEETTVTHVETMQEDQSHATTNFSTDALARTVVAQNPGTTGNFDLLKAPDWSRLTLSQLLSQPVPIQNGVQVEGDAISVAHSSHSALLTASPFHLEKVRGYLGIRATVVYRLVVNADKFTAGRLVLSYQPSNPYYVERRIDYRHISQLEHVELDLNTDTEVVLKIPHRGPYTHFDITNRKYDTGLFRVTQYLQHRGNPYSWTLYTSFEDIDLLGPTAITTASYEGSLEIEEKHEPISSKVKKLSAAMFTFASVPALTSFMSPLAWVTGVAGGVLSAFGYSRPSTTVTPQVFINRAASKLNQSDGTDYADQMAVTTSASVQVSDQIGLTKNDEMSFAYLTQVNAAMFRFQTSTATPVGTRIFTCPLSPMNMKARSDIQSAVIMHPMAYIANVFDKYRGSIKMTMEIAKTVFHSARYLVVFEPINPEGGSIPPSRVNSIDDAINCHKDIVDIRKGTTFSFTFPFTSLVPYLATERPYGYVHVFVLNALVTTNASVPLTVAVGVKFAACEDMEFSCPSEPRYYPYLPQDGTVSVNLGTDLPQTLDGVVYESGLEIGDAVIADKCIGSSSQPVATVEMAALCVGEKLLSMKQLAMRSKLVVVSIGGKLKIANPFVVDTFYDTQWLGATGGTNSWKQMFDWYSYVGRLYEYVRGGVVLTIHNTQGGQNLLLGVKTDPVRFDLVQPAASPFQEFAMQHIIRSDETDRVYIPPYNNSYVRYALPAAVQGQTGAGTLPDFTWDSGLSHVKFQIMGINDGADTLGYRLWRGAADDTQFGGFKGVPYCILREPWNGQSPPDFKAESFFFPES